MATLLAGSQITDSTAPSAVFTHDGVAVMVCSKGGVNLEVSPDGGANWYDVDHDDHNTINIKAGEGQALAVVMFAGFDYRLNTSCSSTGAVYTS